MGRDEDSSKVGENLGFAGLATRQTLKQDEKSPYSLTSETGFSLLGKTLQDAPG